MGLHSMVKDAILKVQSLNTYPSLIQNFFIIFVNSGLLPGIFSICFYSYLELSIEASTFVHLLILGKNLKFFIQI